MSADGEVEVQVQAEGVDDAAQELGGEGGGIGGGGGGPPGGDDDGGGIGGKLGRLLKVVGAVVAVLGPLLKFIEGIFGVLEAFLAPIALIVLRLLSPFLQFFIRLLPQWLAFIDGVMPTVDAIAAFLIDLLTLIRDVINGTTSIKEALTSDVVGTLLSVPDKIGAAVADKLPSVTPGTTEQQEQVLSDAVRRGAISGATGATPFGPAINIALEGGLGAFVENTEKNSNVDT